MTITFFSTQPYDKNSFSRHSSRFPFQLDFREEKLTPRTARLVSEGSVICVFVNDHVDREVLQVLEQQQVRLIALRCAGFNNVDLEAASECGIRVVRVPAYSPHAVAEHALAMIMTLNRKTHKAYNRIREQNFSLSGLLGSDLFGKTVGVIGTGHIGRVFCTIMKGLGCNVVAYDPHPHPDVEALNISYVTLSDLFTQSDIISLHCPLMPATQYIINSHSIGQMKNGVMLINTSRGALIDTHATINGLKKGKIGALGIDVYEQEENIFFQNLSEEIIQDDTIARLMSFPNVLITAHQGFFTQEALDQIALTTLSSVLDFSEGKPLPNEVTKST